MKKEEKLDEIKKTLENLYKQLPEQFALENVRTYMKKTISSINEVQNKRNKRKLQEQANSKEAEMKKLKFISLSAAKNALDLLDQMMKEEEAKLKQDTNKEKDVKNIEDELLNG